MPESNIRRTSARLKQKAEALQISQEAIARENGPEGPQDGPCKRRKLRSEESSTLESESDASKTTGEKNQLAASRVVPHNATRQRLMNTSNSYPHPLPGHSHSALYPMPYCYPYLYMVPYSYHPPGPYDYSYPMFGTPVLPPQTIPMWNAHHFAHLPPRPADYFPTVASLQPNISAPAVLPLRPPHVEQTSRHSLEEDNELRDERYEHVALFYDKLHSILPKFLEATDPFHLDQDGEWKSDYSIVFDAPLPAALEYYYWPVFREMVDRNVHPDVIKDELQAGLGRNRMLRALQEWRDGLEEKLAWIVTVGRMYLQEDEQSVEKIQKFAGISLMDIALTATMATPPISSNDHSREQILSEYSRNAQLILRADSVFKTSEPKSGLCFYPTDLGALQNDWYYPGPWEHDGESAEAVEKFKRRTPGTVEYDVRAANIARRFLRELGCLDALYIELCAVGSRFLCARCEEFIRPVEWRDMIKHYLKEHDSWDEMLEEHPNITTHPQIKYRNLHDFSNYDEPTIRVVGRAEQGELSLRDETERSNSLLLYCKLCVRLGIMFSNSGREPLEFHVRHVHSVKSPELLKHYGPSRDF